MTFFHKDLHEIWGPITYRFGFNGRPCEVNSGHQRYAIHASMLFYTLSAENFDRWAIGGVKQKTSEKQSPKGSMITSTCQFWAKVREDVSKVCSSSQF